MKDLLKIYAFKDSARKSKLGQFQCMVSPVEVKFHQENLFGQILPLNGSIPLTGFTSGGKSTLEVKVILDGTGAHAQKKDGTPIKLTDQLMDLMKNTVKYHGAIHQPPYLNVVWGSLPIFPCRAESMDVEYKTFNIDGVAVKAETTLLFVEDQDLELNKKKINQQSPDLFHQHIVTDYDTLPSISYQYYGDVGYSKLIARTNDLNSLFDLKPDTTLLIPPLDKQTEYEQPGDRNFGWQKKEGHQQSADLTYLSA